mgnify:CR=1 FL=1
MAQVTASLVKELRDRTGLGMMECKRALTESGADIDKAIEELRKSSGMKAAKKAGRTAADGLVAFKTENGYGMVLEVNSETDFAARDEGFKGFVAAVLDSAFASKQTDIAGFLQNVQEYYGFQNMGAVVLATDGLYNKGRNPEYVENRIEAELSMRNSHIHLKKIPQLKP